jgi:hypothetical protein
LPEAGHVKVLGRRWHSVVGRGVALGVGEAPRQEIA